jgi:pimeloyl-ACP methyl ester carboxylesterase
MADIYKIFVGGGGDDWFSHIVESYAADYTRANQGYKCSYYSWTQGGAIGTLLQGIPKDADVTIVGHSYGADTAFSRIQNGGVVNTLISIDPVGRFRPSWASIRAKAQMWLNVRAEPSEANRTRDDVIASIGGKYPRPPAAGQPGAPNHAFIVDATHGAFSTMMRATSNGVSGRSLLGGAHVG